MMNFFKKRVSKPKFHDFTKRFCGHDYSFHPIDGGVFGSATGWGEGIEKKDILVLENPLNESGVAFYRVDEIAYRLDPRDMWSAELHWIPTQAVWDHWESQRVK